MTWTHADSDPVATGWAALQTARQGAWDGLDPTTQARYVRALVVMSLQAATLQAQPDQIGALNAAAYVDDEHNAAGSAVARTLLLLTPRRPIVVSQSVYTFDGLPPMVTTDPDTGIGVLAVVALVAVAAVAGGVVGWFAGTSSAEKNDRADFREHKTKQLVSTQAAAIEILAKHAERERLAGKPLPFTDDERKLLRSLEDTQRDIMADRRQAMPSPFDGSKTFDSLGQTVTSLFEALLPIAVIGGAFYFMTRGGEGAPAPQERAPPERLAPRYPEAITLTQNEDGVYEYDERNG